MRACPQSHCFLSGPDFYGTINIVFDLTKSAKKKCHATRYSSGMDLSNQVKHNHLCSILERDNIASSISFPSYFYFREPVRKCCETYTIMEVLDLLFKNKSTNFNLSFLGKFLHIIKPLSK